MLRLAMETFSRCTVTVSGASMLPFIRPGDRVILEQSIKKPLLGRCVAFFEGDQLIVHRITRVMKNTPEGTLWSVSGDSSPHSLTMLQPSSCIGMATGAERNGKVHTLWFVPPCTLLAVVIGKLLRSFTASRSRISGRKNLPPSNHPCK
jgi:hypothetical protein